MPSGEPGKRTQRDLPSNTIEAPESKSKKPNTPMGRPSNPTAAEGCPNTEMALANASAFDSRTGDEVLSVTPRAHHFFSQSNQYAENFILSPKFS